MIKSLNPKKNNGFSIAEVMIAITIFSIGIIGVSSMMLQTMQAETLNAGHLKASMLAQEGLELVRGLRDENWIRLELDPTLTAEDIPWDNLFSQTDTGGAFAIDYLGNYYTGLGDISHASTTLRLNSGDFYEHATGIPTNFKRLITVNDSCPIGGVDCWNVIATVQWTSSGKINNYRAQTTLYDWR